LGDGLFKKKKIYPAKALNNSSEIEGDKLVEE
jgi:hypothetical protein